MDGLGNAFVSMMILNLSGRAHAQTRFFFSGTFSSFYFESVGTRAHADTFSSLCLSSMGAQRATSSHLKTVKINLMSGIKLSK